jgi:hypothetical protein
VGPRFSGGSTTDGGPSFKQLLRKQRAVHRITSDHHLTSGPNLASCQSARERAAKFEGNREAREALTLSVAGVILAMVIWSLMMLLFY